MLKPTDTARYPGKRPVIVLQHGLGGNRCGEWWRARILAGSGYVVETHTAVAGATTTESYVNAVRATRAAIAFMKSPSNPYATVSDTSRLGLGGHSMGSIVTSSLQVKINGFDIGGWTVGTSSLTRVSDATVVNVGGSVLNSGTFGTNLTCDATALPAGYIKCADEGGTCSFPGLETVYFGSNNGCFATETATTSISCDSTTFGMPAGDSRSCYVDAKSITLSPACPQSGGVILYWTKDYACTGAGADAGKASAAASATKMAR